MKFIEVSESTYKLNGKYEVRGTTYTDGGNTFYYVWEVEFNNETVKDFLTVAGINTLAITGLRYLEPIA